METENNEPTTKDNEPEIVSEAGNETPQEDGSANGIHTVKVSEMESTSSITDDGCFYYVDGNGESKKVSPSAIATYVRTTTTTSTGSLVPDWSQAISTNSIYAQNIEISPTSTAGFKSYATSTYHYNKNKYVFPSDVTNLSSVTVGNGASFSASGALKNYAAQGVFVKANTSYNFYFNQGGYKTLYIVPCIKV